VFKVTVRSLMAHRVRLAVTAVVIMLGTGFMAGSFVFTATLTQSLNALFAESAAGTDVIIRHAAPAGGSFAAGSGGSKPIPAAIATAIRRLPAVAAVDGVVSGRAVLLGRDRKPLPGAFGVALSWPANAPFQAIFTKRSGAPPAGPGQVMIDRASAIRGSYAIGDVIEIAISGQARQFTITGITGYGSANSIGGGSMAIFSLPAAQHLFGLAGHYSQIDVKGAAGTSAEQLRSQAAGVLPPGVQAVTAATAAASQASQLNRQLGFLTYFFAGFACVSLLVGGFVIWNTFSILVNQRVRELALLRTVGARRSQIFRAVLGEAGLLGAVSAGSGVVVGVVLARGLAALLGAFGLALPAAGLVIPPAGASAAFGAGLVITIAAAVPPAWRATGVAPVQALRESVPAPIRSSAGRLTAGLTLAAAGLGLIVVGLQEASPLAITAVGAGTGFLGAIVLAPLLARPLAFAAALPLLLLPGRAAVLARGNAMRNPRRTSATAAALMTGLALIAATSVLIASVRSVLSGQITSNSKTSFYIQAANADTGITPRLASSLARVRGVRGVTEVRTTDASVAGSAHQSVDGIDPSAISDFTGLRVLSGSLASLEAGKLLVSQSAAAAHSWRTGDVATITFGSYSSVRLNIGGIFTGQGPLSGYLVSTAAFTADTGILADSLDLVRAPRSARGQLLRALTAYPGAQLLDQAGYASSRGTRLDTIRALITALLALAIIIALLGIISTLALSVAERTRELGLLRALGMSRGRLGLMIAAESVIIATIGAVEGTALGLGLGAALAAALTKSQQVTVTIPAGQIAVYAVAAALAGLLAAAGPARRAGRLDLLTALAAV
jgi:putative ABC transport system permease protein